MSVLIIGAGGHAKVVADILLAMRQDVLGYVDDDPLLWGHSYLGLPVLGPIELLSVLEFDRVVCAIGANRVRHTLVERFSSIVNGRWINAIHPQAVIGRGVQLHEGVVIAAGVVVCVDTEIREHSIINTGSSVDHDCCIGAYAHVAPGSHLAGGVRVGEGSLLGVGVSVIPNITVGEWTVIGAGATAVSDIPPNVVARGTPARWSESG